MSADAAMVICNLWLAAAVVTTADGREQLAEGVNDFDLVHRPDVV